MGKFKYIKNYFDGLIDSLAIGVNTNICRINNKSAQILPFLFNAIERKAVICKCKKLINAEDDLYSKKEVTVKPLRNVSNTESSVLSSTTLSVLPRPSKTILEGLKISVEQQDLKLKEVMRHSQARICENSVSFVMFIQDETTESIQKTFQSIFRQTSPSWELILCSADASKNGLEEWLDRDWRIRRINPETSKLLVLLKSSTSSTSKYICQITPGEVIEDDMVRNICRSDANVRGSIGIYINESKDKINSFTFKEAIDYDLKSTSSSDEFLIFRKSYILNKSYKTWGLFSSAEDVAVR